MSSPHRTVLELREIMEPWCAAFAASRRSHADLRRIQQAHERGTSSIDHIGHYVEAGQAWHTAVAEASHNELLAAFMRARSDAVLSASDRARYDSLEARRATLRVHQDITTAISDQDPDRAFRLMSEHVRGGTAPLLDVLVTALKPSI